MEIVVFTLNAIVIYGLSDWIVRTIERRRGEVLKNRQVVFFAIGFETTAPANVMSVLQADQLGLDNFSVLVSRFETGLAVPVDITNHSFQRPASADLIMQPRIEGCEVAAEPIR